MAHVGLHVEQLNLTRRETSVLTVCETPVEKLLVGCNLGHPIIDLALTKIKQIMLSLDVV